MKVSLQKQVVGLIWPKDPQFASPVLAQFRVSNWVPQNSRVFEVLRELCKCLAVIQILLIYLESYNNNVLSQHAGQCVK